MERSKSIKRLIFLVNYVVPLLIFIGAFAIGSFGDLVYNGVFIFFFVLAFLILLFLNRKKYIYSYHKNESNMEIRSYNIFFKSQKMIIPISNLSEIGTTRQQLLGKYSYLFKVREKEKWIKYEILDAPLKNYIILNLPMPSL